MSITDADRLAYEPPKLALSDGRKLQLHFGYGGLRRIEQRFGSLQGLTDGLQAGAEGEFFSAVFGGLLCGLWKTGITEEDLEEQIDPSDIQAHGELLSEALMHAFPRQAQEMAKAAQAEAEGVAEIKSLNSSTGPEVPISPSQFLDSHATSSGS